MTATGRLSRRADNPLLDDVRGGVEPRVDGASAYELVRDAVSRAISSTLVPFRRACTHRCVRACTTWFDSSASPGWRVARGNGPNGAVARLTVYGLTPSRTAMSARDSPSRRRTSHSSARNRGTATPVTVERTWPAHELDDDGETGARGRGPTSAMGCSQPASIRGWTRRRPRTRWPDATLGDPTRTCRLLSRH